jgi:hypothetical protein
MLDEPQGAGNRSERATLIARLVVFALLAAAGILYFIESYFR